MPISSLELIQRVKEHPEVWLWSHPNHMNRAVLRRFWTNLAEEFDESELKLRKRWKHYKDQFRKEFKKQKERQIPDDQIIWQYYEPLCFLKLSMDEKDKQLAAMESDADDDDDNVPLVKVGGKYDRLRKGRIVKKVPNPKLDIILRKVTETKAVVEERLTDLNAINRNDPDFLFLLSLVPHIKQLSEIQKLQFKGKINEWLLQQITINTYGKSDDTYIVDVKPEY